MQENETNEMFLSEDAMRTTAYLTNTPNCCSGAEQLENMLGVGVMDEAVHVKEEKP